ncbi:glycosyltransferase [Metabacillus lacus]|uniref:glycosyltransferase n=1 Tax=Metabacillus lacus TaxID=1983721 RepID=UPI0014781849|nr:glycosyltransferase family 2 protein [Metabacillus lacus]
MGIIAAAITIGIFIFWSIPVLSARPKAESRELFSKVTIIIPARDEEKNIAVLLDSLNKQTEENLEIIVANDQSADSTAEIAKAKGAAVLDVPDLPQGWLGKSWACWQGARQSSKEWLLFIDADTYFEKNGLLRILEAFQDQKEGSVLSIHPFHAVKKGYESLSMLFHIVIYGSMGAFHPLQRKLSSNGAFGQCMIIRKRDYGKFGGHEAIKGRIVENMAFARHVKKQGGKVRCISGRHAISMRMYPNGWSELIKGWSKSFASGAGTTSKVSLVLVFIWLTGMFTFIPAALSSTVSYHWVPILILYAAAVLQIYTIAVRIGTFSFWHALFFPVHLLFFAGVFLFSFLQTYLTRNAKWKGRSIAEKEQA